ncbi:MAG: energy transducer TonB [Bacteroidales bacterium]|nr:energy transducer TonB [Bacteroidales bacterium]
MPAFLIYEVKVAVALAIFYMFYRLMLRKETFHCFNRVVLVGTAVLAFLLPFCIITIQRPMELAQAVESVLIQAEEPVSLDMAPALEASAPWWSTAIAALFWAGVGVMLGRALLSILSIVRIVLLGTLVREEDGCKIIVSERDIDPFSWMRYIVLSKKDWEGPHESILAHEKAHIGLKHSADLLLVDVLSAFQWFNPAIWMLRADLQELHEYEADDAVLRAGTNIKEYQYLLIRKAVSKSGYSVANSFNHSILKNRITMMSKSKSPLSRGLRVLYLLPLVCLGIGLQARTIYVPVDKDSEKIPADEKFEYVLNKVTVVKYAPATVKEEDVVHVNNVGEIQLTAGKNFDTAPVCSENFSYWLTSRIQYPDDCLYDGTLVAMFTIGEDGKVGSVQIMNSLCEQLDKIVVKAIEKSPVWTPAMKDGKPVATVLFQPVTFMIRVSFKAQLTTTISLKVLPDGKVENDGKIYTKEQIKDIVPAHKAGEPQTIVQITAADNVPVGAVDDVKTELRKLESLRIRYVSEPTQDGVTRYLPPMLIPVSQVKAQVSKDVNRENLFIVRINSADKVFFGNKVTQDEEEMVQMAKGFLKQHGRDTRFSLQADRGTSYGAYVRMQELLRRVYSEVRNEKAQEVYGKPMSELTVEERNQINYLVPVGIAELELKNGK